MPKSVQIIRSSVSYINPNPGNCGSSIQKPTIHANNFELKPQLITLVQNNCSFGVSVQEDPNQHLTTFLRIYDTVKSNGIHPDTYRLLLFPFSLKDKASKWLESLPKESFTTWEDVVNKFWQDFTHLRESTGWELMYKPSGNKMVKLSMRHGKGLTT